ncbi:Uncharacterised protein [uncultured archaeon]|nr:Uncharacterised protein [uncultured archaeon]
MVENFYKKKLIEYLKKNMRKGYPMETLRVALVNQNYSRTVIDEAIKEAVKELANEAPVLKEKPQIEHEIITEEPVVVKKSFWQKIVGFFKK